jgi:hypothetical protein
MTGAGASATAAGTGGHAVRDPHQGAARGETVIEDAVQGRVVVQNSELDDMILLRSTARRPTCSRWWSTITTWA